MRGPDAGCFEMGIVAPDVFDVVTRRETTEKMLDRDARARNHRLAEPDLRVAFDAPMRLRGQDGWFGVFRIPFDWPSRRANAPGPAGIQ